MCTVVNGRLEGHAKKSFSLERMSVSLRAGIPPFYVMDVWLAAAERQRTHGDLVNLSAGQPSAGAPAAVRAAAKEALDNTVLGYTVALGIPELRTAIATSYQLRQGLVVDPNEVVITTGSSGGFLLAFLACFDVGDRVAIASPGYPCYRNILSALGCEVVEIPCGPETRFQPTARMLAELDPPVQGVIVASPANPTGTVIPPEELAAIASWCEASGVRLVSDEVYHGLVYEGAPRHQLRMADVAGCRCGEQLFEVLRDDRLAARLAAGAAGAAARGGLPDRELHHLPAGVGPDGRGRGVHPGVDRRGGRPASPLRRQPAAAARRAAAGSGSIGWRRPTARSTSTPTFRT